MPLMSICLVVVFARFIRRGEAIEVLVESKVTVPFFAEVVAARMTPLAQPFHSLMAAVVSTGYLGKCSESFVGAFRK